jgi:hypothetical protein
MICSCFGAPTATGRPSDVGFGLTRGTAMMRLTYRLISSYGEWSISALRDEGHRATEILRRANRDRTVNHITRSGYRLRGRDDRG